MALKLPIQRQRAPRTAMLLLMGQISGIIFILGMDIFKSPETGSMTLPLIVLIGLMVLGLILSTRLREPSIFLTDN